MSEKRRQAERKTGYLKSVWQEENKNRVAFTERIEAALLF